MTTAFDKMYIGKDEKELKANAEMFRMFIKTLIEKRRLKMQKENKLMNEDFLGILLNEDLFKDKDEMIIDECITFMFAST